MRRRLLDVTELLAGLSLAAWAVWEGGSIAGWAVFGIILVTTGAAGLVRSR